MEIDYLTIFIETVNHRLSEIGLSKNELAEKLGINRSGVSKLLKASSNPTLERIVALAKTIGLKPWQLIQPKKDKLLIENLIPFQILEKLSKLSPGKQQKVLESLYSMIDLASSDDDSPPKKKVSGL